MIPVNSSIKSFSVHKLHVPVGRVIGDSMCHYEAFRMAVVRLETRSGLVGWGFGEKAHGGYFAKEAAWNRPLPSPSALSAAFEERFWPWLKSRSALASKLIMPKKIIAGDDALVLATRMALWDLIGKEAELPLFRLLGGEDARESVPAYASACEFQQSDEFLRDFYSAKMRDGFRMFKIKVGHPDPTRDLRRLLIMREVIGADCSLAADANKAWTAEETIERIAFFNDNGVDLAYIEDPLDPLDLDGHRRLAEGCPVPVVGHDYAREASDTRALLKTGALGMLRARDGLDYGIELLPLAMEFDRPMIVANTPFEWNIHFAQSCPQVGRIEFSDQAWNRLPKSPVTIKEGRMFAPQSPGHGFDPDPEVFSAWSIDE